MIRWSMGDGANNHRRGGWWVGERIPLKFQLAICCTWLAPCQVNTWILETNKA